jgi:protein-tyrosine phosphatase
LSAGLEQAFFALRIAGWRPILAHPERHGELARNPERIQRLYDQDLLLQVNAGSLVGQFGRRAMATAQLLIERGWADFVSSDGHDLNKRPMSVRVASERLVTLVGTARTHQLLVVNPTCVMSGEQIEPYRPAPSRRGSGFGQWIQ